MDNKAEWFEADRSENIITFDYTYFHFVNLLSIFQHFTTNTMVREPDVPTLLIPKQSPSWFYVHPILSTYLLKTISM